jgi:putative addiction module component (TIGR02574 family)
MVEDSGDGFLAFQPESLIDRHARSRHHYIMDVKEIEAEALSLPSEERASLAHRLPLSLEDISDAELEQVWAEESARRAAAVDSGRATAIPADDVAKKARALLR